MPTSMVVVLDSIAAARPALSGAVLHARNADRAADARRALPKAEAVVVGDVETDVPLRPIPPPEVLEPGRRQLPGQYARWDGRDRSTVD